MDVRFWGVRGSIAVSGARYVQTGGNTTCVEVSSQGERLILDGGTGLRALGESYGWQAMEATLLFTHVHWDHIQGVPFFGPAFHPDSKLRFLGAKRSSGTLRAALDAQMQPPTFPITLDAIPAHLEFRTVATGAPWEMGPFRVTALDMAHPDGVVAYRIEDSESSLVFATDVEHGPELDARLLELAEGVDLLIHDAQFTDEEYAGKKGPSRRGWGHSTWPQAVRAARICGAGRLALFHHDPMRDDCQVSTIEARARLSFANAFVAREGEVVAL